MTLELGNVAPPALGQQGVTQAMITSVVVNVGIGHPVDRGAGRLVSSNCEGGGRNQLAADLAAFRARPAELFKQLVGPGNDTQTVVWHLAMLGDVADPKLVGRAPSSTSKPTTRPSTKSRLSAAKNLGSSFRRRSQAALGRGWPGHPGRRTCRPEIGTRQLGG